MDIKNLNSIGIRLFELRKERGISQEGLALEVGLKIDTYRAIEQGKTRGRIDTLVILADYFHVSLDYLICDKKNVANELEIQTDVLSEESKEKVYRIMKAVIHEIG
ncbi:MAG: helix-turn-helix domain-containing protein [Clostridium sp.]|nr:helix-turn-helix domain-containing protein [Clostridium sp.]MCM1172048.1 helix-turn-helix domain-containing protein [Clostridium sp.]MCM1209049.1 helix-turn-helix domain-containing protein [Ruminococcus sp.]MCM1400086.1 helix-turn-helix domain-containing protein [Clostridium sp.]MCM1459638.1 helix-turn-helix domain-containing protein [Bacteroides sp.]